MKSIYIGENDKAKRSTNVHFGVDNISRKVSKMYIGDESGTARLCYSAERFLSDIHEFTDELDVVPGIDLYSVDNFNDTIVFAGGRKIINGEQELIPDIYLVNSDLTVNHLPNALTHKVYYHESCIVANKYIVFAGGRNNRDECSYYLQIFDKSMTNVYTGSTNFSTSRASTGSVGNYGLIFSGVGKINSGSSDPDIFDYMVSIDENLTVRFHTDMVGGRTYAGCACDKKYAIFAGGNSDKTYSLESGYVDAYDAELTHTQLSNISDCYTTHGTTLNGYYLFGAPSFNDENINSYYIDRYDSSLTKVSSLSLSNQKRNATSLTTGDEALYVGGYKSATNFNTYYNEDIEIFDKDFTRTLKKLESEKCSSNIIIGTKLKDKIFFMYSNKTCELIKLK